MSPLIGQLAPRAALVREVVRDGLRWYLTRLRDTRSDIGRMHAGVGGWSGVQDGGSLDAPAPCYIDLDRGP